MNDLMFWNLIEAAHRETNGDVERQIAALVSALCNMSVDEIFGFENLFIHYLDAAYDERLWAAGSILDELSNDGFWDFRAWLILQGRDAYANALDNPENLMSVVRPGARVTAEEMSGITQAAYRASTGKDDFSAVFQSRMNHPPIKNSSLDWKTKEGYPDAEKLRLLYPMLWDRFGNRF